MLQEYWHSVTAQLRHRTTSPLVGAYVLSWLLVNYQVPLLMFSNVGVERKLVLLNDVLKPASWVGVWGCYGIPLLFSLAFLGIYPLLSRPVYWWWHRQQNLLIEIRKRIEDERPLTREEEQAIRKDIWAQAAKHAQELRERDQRIKDLEERFEVATGEMDERAAEPAKDESSPFSANLTDRLVLDDALSRLNDEQRSLLRTFYEHNGSIALFEIYESGKPSVEVKHAAEVLEEMGLAKLHNRSWSLTARGNAVAVHAANTFWS